MPKEGRFLLINGRRDHCWRQVLEEALAPLGALQTGDEEEAVKLVLQQSYDLVIIDATAVKNVPLLVSRIRAQRPDGRLVVATASPTWRRAREAFQAGAADYIRKSLDREEILLTVQATLDKKPTPWPY
jgi:DNA-binding NarL/FixJ family response regulator